MTTASAWGKPTVDFAAESGGGIGYNRWSMATLLENPPNPLTLRDVAEISQSLADDLSRLVFRTEGFTEEDYMTLDGNYFVEYIDGCLQILPMPDAIHQILTTILFNMFSAWRSAHDPDGRVLLAPFKIKLRDGQYREPDVCYMRGENAARRTRKFWTRADLVVEVLSDSNRDHDLVTKRREYALNQIPEYWIVDSDQRLITVLSLQGSAYRVHGEYREGQSAESALLTGFSVDVRRLFDDAEAQA